jgi:hypothetical protein
VSVTRTEVQAIVRAELRSLEYEQELARRALAAVLRVELKLEVEAITRRIDEVHEKALRELTRVHSIVSTGGTE